MIIYRWVKKCPKCGRAWTFKNSITRCPYCGVDVEEQMLTEKGYHELRRKQNGCRLKIK